jgi:hypothetical protein
MTDTIEHEPEVTTVRWIATVYYRSASGIIDVQHDMLELDELHDLVERGPHWDCIDRIEVVRADGRNRALTLEEAEKL